jgi:hypothetical protein
MRRRVTRERSGESGFALLLVFVMAAAVSILLFMEVPRVAFESQRMREQMTIDRGLQYERAIQLFYRKYRLYPQTLDDLETTRNIRFLRRRYKDPLTGKDYRLLHVGPAGQLTDSLVTPPAPLPGSTTGSGLGSSPGASNATGSAFGSSFGSSFGSGSNSQPAPAQSGNVASANGSPDPNNPNDPNAQQAPDPLNMAARRPSDRIIGVQTAANPNGGNPGEPDPNQPPQPDPNQPQQPVQTGQLPVPVQQPVLPGQQPIPGQPVQQPADPNQPSDPNQPNQPGNPPDPSQPQNPGQNPGQAPQPQPPIQFPTAIPPGATTSSPGQPQFPGAPGMPGQAGVPGFAGQAAGQPGGVPGQAGGPQSAANMIQQLLTTPRQAPSSISTGFTSGNTGGIAGVASTAEGKGIHKVNDRTKYKEWEFVYDLKKDKTVVGAAAVNAQQNVQQQMQQNQNSSPFGTSSTSGIGNSTSPFNSQTSTPAAPAQTNPSAPASPPPSQ